MATSATETIGSRNDSISSSQYLSSPVTSLSNSTSSRNSGTQISKIYRQSSTLFLTRRLPESLSTILPLITPTTSEENGIAHFEAAPILKASRTTRIKVWSLYLTILNAVAELDPDEGKGVFGNKEWRSLVSKVREGMVWEEVVKNGYGGVEGDVDSDVVINLATLLLAHARTQKLNQQRLEAYLAASSTPNLDITNHLHTPKERPSTRRSQSKSGTDTPRDLNARVKILELYTLHVLLRNEEWDYAREFISMSEVLDDERREAFLQALQSLQEEQAAVAHREREAQRQHEEQLERDLDEARRRRIENEEVERRRHEVERRPGQREGSEVDYGIESPKRSSVKGSRSSRASALSPRQTPNSNSRVVTPPTYAKRAAAIITNLRKVLANMANSFQSNPVVLLQTLAFVIGLLLVLSRKDVKERVKRVLGNSWDKVKATAGMGVKVSYI